MKNLIFILVLFCSCRKNYPVDESNIDTGKQLSAPVAEVGINNYDGVIGIPGHRYDLHIVEFSNDYDGWINGYGLRYTGDNFHLINYNGKPEFEYNCPIENLMPQTPDNTNDFCIDMSDEGIYLGGYDYQFKGFLSRILFENGLPVYVPVKEVFYTQTTDTRNGYNWDWHRDYYYDTMYIGAQGADLYVNRADVKATNGVADDREYLLVVSVNAKNDIDQSNNTSTLPFGIRNHSTCYMDTAIIAKNKCQPVKDFTGKFTPRYKTVTLTIECPYHSPIYVPHTLTIKKGNIVLIQNLPVIEGIMPTFTDNVEPNFKSAEYSVIVNVPGLGSSPPLTKTIFR